jgi:hypothetical protein
VLVACGSATRASQKDLDGLAQSRLGSHYTITYNASKAYAICEQTPSGDHINRKFKFIVVETSSNTIVKEGSFRNGYVKWIDEHSIEVSSSGLDEKQDRQVINVKGQKS